MRIIRADVENLVVKELELANSKFPPFNSTHEGYAVIREEWKEHGREAQEMSEILQCLEDAVFTNDTAAKYINSLEMVAVNAACEAIQVAAMCRKFRALEGS
jgi:hypothetical protein